MRVVRTVMGFPVSLDVRSETDDSAVEAAFEVLVRADEVFSPFRADSEISRLNRGELGQASAVVLEVMLLAAEAERRSRGAFTVHTPRGVDANGVVKGWAVQRAADVLAEAGVSDFCLNAGGDIAVRGEPAPGQAWQAGIRSPWHPRAIAGVVRLPGAIATSGAYERGAHLRDGRTGETANAFASVSVLHDDLAVADIAATAVMALGPDGPAWARDEYGCGVVTISHTGVLDTVGPVDWAAA